MHEEHPNSVFELAMFSLKKKAFSKYLSNYNQFESSIKKLDGFKWVHTYQNIHNPDELVDIAEWEDLKKAKAADEFVQQSPDFAAVFNTMEKLEYFNHLSYTGSVSKNNVNERAFMEVYVYRVEKDNIERHLEVKKLFAEYLKKEVPGYMELSWFQAVDNPEWQVDLYFYEQFSGIQENNKAVEASKPSQELMATIAELKHFKTFSPLIKEPKKVDLSKTNKNYYQAGNGVEEKKLDSHSYLSVSGIGAPESEAFNNGVSDLYGVAYKVKFSSKALGMDFVVPKMEGFWFVEEGQKFSEAERDEWHWEIMIPIPDFVHHSVVKSRIDELDMAERVFFKEQKSAKHIQKLHLGSYDAEEETIGAIHSYIKENNYSFAGHHREVYLNDPRKTAEEKLKTIIRYEVA